MSFFGMALAILYGCKDTLFFQVNRLFQQKNGLLASPDPIFLHPFPDAFLLFRI